MKNGATNVEPEPLIVPAGALRSAARYAAAPPESEVAAEPGVVVVAGEVDDEPHAANRTLAERPASARIRVVAARERGIAPGTDGSSIVGSDLQVKNHD